MYQLLLYIPVFTFHHKASALFRGFPVLSQVGTPASPAPDYPLAIVLCYPATLRITISEQLSLGTDTLIFLGTFYTHTHIIRIFLSDISLALLYTRSCKNLARKKVGTFYLTKERQRVMKSFPLVKSCVLNFTCFGLEANILNFKLTFSKQKKNIYRCTFSDYIFMKASPYSDHVLKYFKYRISLCGNQQCEQTAHENFPVTRRGSICDCRCDNLLLYLYLSITI